MGSSKQSEHKREVDDLNEQHAMQLKNRPKSSDSATRYRSFTPTTGIISGAWTGGVDSAEQATRNLSDHSETELVFDGRSGEVVKKHRTVRAARVSLRFA